MLEALISALTPLPLGWLELPESHGERAYALCKGAGHRYIKRVPTGKLTKTGKMRYRYFYHVGHGGGVHAEDHFVEGAAFRFEGGHYHIEAADGDKLTIRHDETGERKTVSKAELREMLGAHHAEGIAAHRARVAQDLADAKEHGASAKQVARLTERAARVGVDTNDDFETETDALPELRDRDQDIASRRASTREGRDFFRNAKVGTEVETPKGSGRVVGFNHAGTMMVKTAGGEVNVYTSHVDANPGAYRVSGAARVGVAEPKAEAKPAMFSEGSYTSKKGNLKKVAVFTGRVSGDEFKALAATAKEHGGSYIRDAGGFVFMGDAGFASFMAAQGDEPAPAKVEAPAPSVAKVEPKATSAETQRKAPRIAKWTAPEYGSKYDGKRGMVDIAKDVRSDIKAAMKAGAIPEGVKLSIRSQDGRSLRVSVQEAPFQVLNPARMEKDRDDPHTYTTIPIHTPEAKEVLDRIEAIVDSYNRKRHNGGPFDDPSVAFYSNVSYDYDLHKRDREAFKAGAAPKVAVVAPLRSQVKPEDLAPKNTAAQVTKLRETAAKVRADADAELGKDRNVNTRRRAEMASGIIERAERQGKLADAIGRAADAIEAGDAPALAAMTSKAQAQVLQNVARLAHMKSMSYGEWERSGADAMHPPADVIRYIDRLPGEESSATLARMGVTSVPKLQTAVAEWLRVTDPKGAATSGAAASKRAEIEESNLMRQGITGYFPTPKPLADKMVHAAHIERGMTVLEPSAGSGRIADAAKAAGADVAVVERSSALREHLKGKGYDLAGDDALAHSGKYDRVVMNPPFEGMQDVDHVRHAFENNLKPGGRLVAIMGEGPFFREDKKAQAFREWLDANGGYSEKLPSGTFESSGTLVSSRMIVVDKPKVATPTPATRDPRLDEADALTAKANQTWSVHTQVGSGSMRTKSHLRRIDADVKRSVEAAKLHQKAANLRAQVERERTQPAPVTAPAQPKAAEQPAKKTPQTINADQKARGVSKERAAAEAAAWKRAGKDLRGFYGGVPTIMRGGSLVALGSLSDAELGMGKGTLSPLLDLLGGA